MTDQMQAMVSWLKHSSNKAENMEKEAKKKVKTEPTKCNQNQEEYTVMEFTSVSCDPPKAVFFICREKLANSCTKPAQLQQHISTNINAMLVSHQSFFKRELSDFRSSQETMQKVSRISAKALKASYAVSLLIAKAKKPFIIAEDLFLPAATMLDKNAADKLKTVPLLNDTVCHRIDMMETNIIDQLGECFSLQLDKSIDVSGNAQLTAFVRYIDTDDIFENTLF